MKRRFLTNIFNAITVPGSRRFPKNGTPFALNRAELIRELTDGSMRRSFSNSFNPPSSRERGVVALEFILVFPLLFILLLAVFEFGLIMAAAKHVEMAARLGAKQAAEAMNLGIFNNPSVADNLKDQVDEYLITAGYTPACQTILEHRVGGVGGQVQHNPPSCPCPCSPEIGSLGSLPLNAVRVTVCLPMIGNVPNCLSSFGFDLTNCTIQQSVVWVYEQSP